MMNAVSEVKLGRDHYKPPSAITATSTLSPPGTVARPAHTIDVLSCRRPDRAPSRQKKSRFPESLPFMKPLMCLVAFFSVFQVPLFGEDWSCFRGPNGQ